MNTAKVFKNGRSQAIRLPKEYRFKTKEVYINKIDNIIVLFPKTKIWDSFEKSLERFSLDFMSERKELHCERRDLFK